MTICVSVKIAEGLVLAADSAVTMQQTGFDDSGKPVSQKIIQSFNYASKVTQLKDYPVGVMSWGMAGIQKRSIQSLIMEYEHELKPKNDDDEYSVNELAQGLHDFIMERYNAYYEHGDSKKTPPEYRSFGMLIGGYSYREFFPEQYVFEYPAIPDLHTVRPDINGMSDFGANWFGLSDALTRLVNGFDPNGLQQLVAMGVDPKIIQKWINSNPCPLRITFDGMPIQDAVDFAEYCVQVVIGRYRFGEGPNLCGGDIDIAVMRPDSFAWAQRKRWSIKEEMV